MVAATCARMALGPLAQTGKVETTMEFGKRTKLKAEYVHKPVRGTRRRRRAAWAVCVWVGGCGGGGDVQQGGWEHMRVGPLCVAPAMAGSCSFGLLCTEHARAHTHAHSHTHACAMHTHMRLRAAQSARPVLTLSVKPGGSWAKQVSLKASGTRDARLTLEAEPSNKVGIGGRRWSGVDGRVGGWVLVRWRAWQSFLGVWWVRGGTGGGGSKGPLVSGQSRL